MPGNSIDIKNILLEFAGDRNVITIHRPFVEFTGSLEAAILLSQLLYWTPRSGNNGWVAKSDAEFCEELCLSRYALRSAKATLSKMCILETVVKRYNGSPTTHYRVDLDALVTLWQAKFQECDNGLSENRQSIVRNQTVDCTKSDNPLSESRQSLTEITTETTTEIVNNNNNNGAKNFLETRQSDFQEPPPLTEENNDFGRISRAYESEIGSLTPMIGDEIDQSLREYPPEWIEAAIHEAALSQARNWRYVSAILKNWKIHGFGWRPPRKVASPTTPLTVGEMKKRNGKPQPSAEEILKILEGA